MSWSSVPTPVTGTTVATVGFGIPVAGNMSVLGGAWVDDTLARTAAAIWTTTGATLGNGTLVSRYRLTGKTLDWLLILTFGSTTSPGSAQFTFAYPAGVTVLNPGAVVAARSFDSSGSATYMGQGVLNAATVNLQSISSAAGLMTPTNATTPMTWAGSDVAAFLIAGLETA